MIKKLSLVFLLTCLSLTAAANSLIYIGEGVRQNTIGSSFDTYKMVHHAANTHRALTPDVARTLDLTMIASWGFFFTKEKMIEALKDSLLANMTSEEFAAYSGEVEKFKKTLLQLPINPGTQLQFVHVPGEGLRILMNGKLVLRSADSNFSMKVFSIWLGKASANANNRGSLEQLIENLWKNAN